MLAIVSKTTGPKYLTFFKGAHWFLNFIYVVYAISYGFYLNIMSNKDTLKNFKNPLTRKQILKKFEYFENLYK